LPPSDLLFATGLAYRETTDCLRKIYNKEIINDIEKYKLSGVVGSATGRGFGRRSI
jgi:hypothetical protein